MQLPSGKLAATWQPTRRIASSKVLLTTLVSGKCVTFVADILSTQSRITCRWLTLAAELTQEDGDTTLEANIAEDGRVIAEMEGLEDRLGTSSASLAKKNTPRVT